MSDSVLGSLAALATAVVWTSTVMFFQSAGQRVGSLPVNLLRLVLGLFFLLVANLLWRGQAWPLDASGHAWLWLALSGLVGFSLGDLFLFRAFVLVGGRLAMLVMSLVPPLTAIIAALALGESLNATGWLGMAVTVSGVAWVVLEREGTGGARAGARSYWQGLLFAFLGAVGQASGLVLSKYGMGSYHPLPSTIIRVLAGIAGFTLVITVLGRWRQVRQALDDRGALLRIAAGAFFGPFLGVTLSLTSVQLIAAGVASTIMSIVPVLILAPAALIFKEKIGPRAVLGALLAVCGVALLFLT